ncbi:SDR family oxidoreductase [Foetidibacter luteolus]|uniref:SDR family oxidoreductase n=1 Tax=Foetidibacter luteolus TaxID=2608880 RepID=UPI00129A145B|nr:NAD(P)H-binding protein [Foetidibacter luteolus]
MKIVVIGGTGLIGSKLVSKLNQAGHQVIAASPSSGVNTLTGEGLKEALDGADIVVDVANSPSFEDKAVLEFFETSGHNLLSAAKEAGVKHHIALSVVGTALLQQSGYFRAKQAQEDIIKKSGLPFTIVQATQFFEFLGAIAASGGSEKTIYMTPAFIQPIASDDVVAALADAVAGQPVNGTIEIAGPQKFRIADLIQQYLLKNNDNRNVVADDSATYFGAALNEDTLVPAGKAHTGSINFETWLAASSKKYNAY